MRKYVFLFLAFCAGATTSNAQIKDNAVEQMLFKQAPSFQDVQLNLVAMVPRLHREHKDDTLKAITDYYKKNYATISTILYYDIITQISKRTFKEELPNLKNVDAETGIKLSDAEFYEENIIGYLNWYIAESSTPAVSSYYPEYIKTAFDDYYAFLRQYAGERLETPGLKPVEKWLLFFLSNPDDRLYKALDQPEYNGTALQRAWRKNVKKQHIITGGNWGLTAGVWMPQGNAAMLGVHPNVGFVIGGRFDKVMVDFEAAIKFLRTKEHYVVIADGVPHSTNYFFGGSIGIGGGYELWRRKTNEFDLLGGIAWDGFDALPGSGNSNNNNNNDPSKTLGSFNMNAGLGYKFFFHNPDDPGKKPCSYLGLQARYNFVNYLNEGGTNLSGNAITVGLIVGSYSRRGMARNIVTARPKR